MQSAKIHSAARGKTPKADAGRPSVERLYALSPSAIWQQLRKEHISFWFVCAYLFFEYVRPQTIYPWLDFLPWTALFAVGAFAASFVEGKSQRTGAKRLSILIVLYGVVVLLSSFFAYDPSLAFQHLSDYFNWVVIYFAIVRTVRTQTRFFIFFLLYMLCNFKMTQHGFLSWASRGFKFDQDGVGGAPGWFQNSGEFGIQLCIFTPLIVAFIFAVKPYCSKLVRYILYIVPITAVASTVASSARAALIGLVASAMWSVKASKYFLRTALIVACVLTAIYFAVPEESMARFQNSGSDRTSIHRLDRWHKGWETMKEYPFLGVGHKNWEKYYRDKLDYGVPGTPLVHNLFVESGTEHGFLGLGTLISIFLSMFFVDRNTRMLAKQRGDRFAFYVAHGFDAAVIGLAVSGSFVTVLYYPYVWVHAAFVTALNISVRNDEEKT